MAKANRDAGSKSPRHLFSGAEAARVLALRVGKPSGVVVEVGGIDVDLYPMTTDESNGIFELLNRATNVQAMIAEGNLDASTLLAFISSEGPALMGLLRGVLERSLEIETDEERANFVLWFNRLPAFETIKSVAPKVLEASGLGALFRPPNPAAAEATPEPTLTLATR